MRGSNRRAWTDAEIELVRRLYADERTELIAKALGRPVGSAHCKANALGLRKSRELIIEVARERTARPGHGSHAVRFQPGLTPWNKGRPGTTGRHPNTAANHYTAGNISGRAALSACIVRCAAAKDGRGRWKAEDRCADALQATGTAPALADLCAAAARRIGTWLSTQWQEG